MWSHSTLVCRIFLFCLCRLGVKLWMTFYNIWLQNDLSLSHTTLFVRTSHTPPLFSYQANDIFCVNPPHTPNLHKTLLTLVHLKHNMIWKCHKCFCFEQTLSLQYLAPTSRLSLNLYSHRHFGYDHRQHSKSDAIILLHFITIMLI